MLQILRPDLRSLVPMFLAGSFVAATRPAMAGGPTVPRPPVELSDTDITRELRLPDGDGGFEAAEDSDDWLFMNRAACLCDRDEKATFAVEFDLTTTPSVDDLDAEVVIWAGVSCDSADPETRDNQCVRVQDQTVSQLRDLQNAPDIPVTVRELVGGPDGECPEFDERTRTVYAIFDEDDNGVQEEDGDRPFPLDITADTRPPPVPTEASAVGSEESVIVSWTLPDSRSNDAYYFQVLCARVGGTADPEDDDLPRGEDVYYRTTRDLCGEPDPTVCPRPLADLGSEPDDEPDAGVDDDAGATALARGPSIDAGTDAGEDPGSGTCSDLPGGLEDLDQNFICGSAPQNSTGINVQGLENNVAYRIVLVIADRAGNPLAIDLGEHTPVPVTDFWEHYQESGGKAKGGCSAAQAGVGGGLLLGFAILVGFGVPAALRRRRRGKSSIAGGAALLLVFGLSRTASAQPWWESYDDEPAADEIGPAVPHWNFEIKVGPYYPDVDSEFSGDTHPFEDLYGDGPFVLSGFTIDRYFLYPLGQLGLTFSAGFLSWSANAFREDDGDPQTPIERAIGSKTAFRLVPTTLGVVYRFTAIDDQFRVPLVPYGRAGLSYYYWWTTKPNGDVSEANGEDGRGGSLGWQATVGLALRIERIDPEAELSLRNELGIEHAGLLFEYTVAKVDGFGADDKLSVGDATWFGGINFEF